MTTLDEVEQEATYDQFADKKKSTFDFNKYTSTFDESKVTTEQEQIAARVEQELEGDQKSKQMS